MSIEDAYNFRRINGRLTTSGLVTVDQLLDLRRDGYDAVINLLPDTHDQAIKSEERLVVEQGLAYVHIPVDFGAPTSADVDAFAEVMDARSGQKVHVHCAANYRVSAFYSLYALRRGLCNEAEADQLVHDVWNPSEHPAWTGFMAEERARTLP